MICLKNIPILIEDKDRFLIKDREPLNFIIGEGQYGQKESLITSYEAYFYDIFEKNFRVKYKIQTQINLTSVSSQRRCTTKSQQ